MNERKFEAGSLAEQIDSAKKDIESWPEWLKDSAKFQGQNHSFDSTGSQGAGEGSSPDDEEHSDQS